MTELEQAFNDAWQKSETPLDRLNEALLGNDWQPVIKTHYRLTGWDGLAFRCCVCDQNDHWTVESQTVFVCEHEPIIAGGGLGVRQLDHVLLKSVSRIEER